MLDGHKRGLATSCNPILLKRYSAREVWKCYIHAAAASRNRHSQKDQKSITVCVLIRETGRKEQKHIREFGTTTSEILSCGDWLRDLGVTHVARAYVSHCTSLGRCQEVPFQDLRKAIPVLIVA